MVDIKTIGDIYNPLLRKFKSLGGVEAIVLIYTHVLNCHWVDYF